MLNTNIKLTHNIKLFLIKIKYVKVVNQLFKIIKKINCWLIKIDNTNENNCFKKQII